MKFVAVMFFMLLFILSGNKLCSSYSGGLEKQEATHLADIRSEGINGDRSQVNILLTIIRKPYATNPKSFGPSIDELLVFTALRAFTAPISPLSKERVSRRKPVSRERPEPPAKPRKASRLFSRGLD